MILALVLGLLSCALASPPCDPCAVGQYLYPMCSGPSDRQCVDCVAGESFCVDGIWAQSCNACEGDQITRNCTVQRDARCAADGPEPPAPPTPAPADAPNTTTLALIVTAIVLGLLALLYNLRPSQPPPPKMDKPFLSNIKFS